MFKKIILMLVIFIFILSCSSDNSSNPEDKISSATMKINGVPMTFQIMGYDLHPVANGYQLTLDFSRYVNMPADEQYNISIVTKYKKTGHNIITQFNYYQSVLGQGFFANFVSEGNFMSDVSVNNNKQFKCTASGSMTINSQTVTITDLKINDIYDEPLD